MVDTNVVSYRFKRDSRGHLYTRHLTGQNPAVSFMTVAELYRWSVRRNWGASLLATLQNDLLKYATLPLDDETAWEWARITSIPGRPMDAGDAWIAAAAIRHGIPLVTHNRNHFQHVSGLVVISEAP